QNAFSAPTSVCGSTPLSARIVASPYPPRLRAKPAHASAEGSSVPPTKLIDVGLLARRGGDAWHGPVAFCGAWSGLLVALPALRVGRTGRRRVCGRLRPRTKQGGGAGPGLRCPRRLRRRGRDAAP